MINGLPTLFRIKKKRPQRNCLIHIMANVIHVNLALFHFKIATKQATSLPRQVKSSSLLVLMRLSALPFVFTRQFSITFNLKECASQKTWNFWIVSTSEKWKAVSMEKRYKVPDKTVDMCFFCTLCECLNSNGDSARISFICTSEGHAEGENVAENGF